MELRQVVYEAMDQNGFIYYDGNTKEGVIIDPGAHADVFINYVKKENINIKAILLTHSHGDHIGAVGEIKKALKCPIACHKCESDLLSDSSANLSGGFMAPVEYLADIEFNDGDMFKISENCSVKVIHTPGHTPGGVCYYSEVDKLLFSGDTLFYCSIGRTDFPNVGRKNRTQKKECAYPSSENMLRLVTSVKDKLFLLPDDTTVYPGHGEPTTIGFEKKGNPFLI